MLFLSTSGFTTLKRVARLTAVVALVSACSSNDDGDTTNAAADNTNATQLAFVATGSYPTGQIERVNLSSDYAVDATYPATGDDILVETDGQNIYQVGRFQIDSVTRFSATDTSIVDYQFSVNDPDQSGANPSDIIFVNETKAYLLRYGSPVMWIINPSATTEEDFKIGEIDLSAYDTVDGDDDLDFAPEADSAVIVDDKLFILMQRMTGTLFFPIEKGYVAVVDTTTDTEIDTFTDVTGGLKGIPLDTLNPTNIRYNETTDEIYVTGRGNLYVDFNMLPDDPYQGGLFSIDQDTYQVAQLLDDGDRESNTDEPFIEHTLVLGDDTGYVTLYSGSDPDTFAFINNVYRFNPSTGEIGEAVGAVAGREIGPMALGNDGNVWIGIRGTSPGFSIVDPADDSVEVAFVPTSFNPINIVFLELPEQQ